MLILGVPAAGASPGCPDDELAPQLAAPATAANALVCDINALRALKRLRPVRWDWRLWWVAQRRASELARSDEFRHTPDLGARVAAVGYLMDGPDARVLENLGWGRGPDATPLAMALGWLRSAGHRENLLDPEVRDIGIGLAAGSPIPGGATGIVYVTEFGTTDPRPARARVRTTRSACARLRRPSSSRAMRRWRDRRAQCRTARVRLPLR